MSQTFWLFHVPARCIRDLPRPRVPSPHRALSTSSVTPPTSLRTSQQILRFSAPVDADCPPTHATKGQPCLDWLSRSSALQCRRAPRSKVFESGETTRCPNRIQGGCAEGSPDPRAGSREAPRFKPLRIRLLRSRWPSPAACVREARIDGHDEWLTSSSDRQRRRPGVSSLGGGKRLLNCTFELGPEDSWRWQRCSASPIGNPAGGAVHLRISSDRKKRS